MFVSWNEQQKASEKSKALNKSRVRAFAARVAHQRTLDAQSKEPSTGKKHSSTSNDTDQQPHGTIIVWRGNSDPFRSQKLEITPRLNELLKFLDDVWIPAAQIRLPSPFPPAVRSCFCTERMLQPFDATNDNALIVSDLLPIASALASLTGSLELEQHRVKLKARAIAQLRSRLDFTHGTKYPDQRKRRLKLAPKALMPTADTDIVVGWDPSIDIVAIDLTRSLFVASVNECNNVEAEAHGKMLQWLLQRRSDQQGFVGIQVDELCLALGYDLVRSQLTLTPSIFDVDEWVPACLASQKIAVVDELAPFRQHILNRLDPSIKDTPLERVFLGTYQCFKIWTKADDPTSDFGPDQFWNYVTLSNLLVQLQTTNYSLEVDEILRSPTSTFSLSRRDRVSWLLQACLAYSVLLWQLTNLMDLRIAEQPYWPRGTIVSSALRKHLQEYHSVVASTAKFCEIEHENALLFAYWTGATWYRKTAKSNLEIGSCFFHRGLFNLSAMKGLQCSEDVKAVVETFLPSIHMRPRDWDWLDDFLASSPPPLE